MSELHGFLDHLRETLETLDEQISQARDMSKSKEKTDKSLQWAKTLRDLIELRNQTLDRIKAHLLGRDETGTVREPLNFDSSDNHPLTLFERRIREYLAKPWTVDRLKIKCADCGVESDEIHSHAIYYNGEYGTRPTKLVDLCLGCYEKRPQVEKQADTRSL